MKYKMFVIIAMISAITMSCSNNEDELNGLILDEVWVHDLANDNLASDLRVFFQLKSFNGIEEIQLLIVKETPLNEVSDEYLKSLGNNSYTSITLTDNVSYDTFLNPDQVDTDGDLLKYDQSYFIYLYSPETGIINKAEKTFLFSDNNVVDGFYTGTWSDTLFGSVSVSIIFSSIGNDSYKGPTYISGNFKATYGGSDDGKTTITVDNNEIVSFKYEQFAPNYKGGCPGIYRGVGSINSEFRINVDFTGNDCDGFHDDAQFSLSRVWKN